MKILKKKILKHIEIMKMLKTKLRNKINPMLTSVLCFIAVDFFQHLGAGVEACDRFEKPLKLLQSRSSTLESFPLRVRQNLEMIHPKSPTTHSQ
jgi:hypothetical protein